MFYNINYIKVEKYLKILGLALNKKYYICSIVNNYT